MVSLYFLFFYSPCFQFPSGFIRKVRNAVVLRRAFYSAKWRSDTDVSPYETILIFQESGLDKAAAWGTELFYKTGYFKTESCRTVFLKQEWHILIKKKKIIMNIVFIMKLLNNAQTKPAIKPYINSSYTIINWNKSIH